MPSGACYWTVATFTGSSESGTSSVSWISLKKYDVLNTRVNVGMKVVFGALKSIGAMMPMSKSVSFGSAASTPAASTVAASAAASATRCVAAYVPSPTPGIDQSSVVIVES